MMSDDYFDYGDIPDQEDDEYPETIWNFYLSDIYGNQMLEGHADSYTSLRQVCRTIYAEYPLANLFIENAATGAGVMFIPEEPHVATFVITEARIIRIVDQLYAPSDWHIWAHLTNDGEYDPYAESIDFIASGEALVGAQVSRNILLN